MKMYSLIILLLLSIGILGCGINDSNPVNTYNSAELYKSNNRRIIYYNSFESDKDTSSFWGIRPEMFVEDPAPGGGMKSLLIGGGCLQPVGSLTLKIKDEGMYNICYLAKTGDMGGMIEVRVKSDGYSYSKIAEIQNNKWEKRQFNNVYCPQGSLLIFDLLVGGIVYASANIDEIKIELRNRLAVEQARSENNLRN